MAIIKSCSRIHPCLALILAVCCLGGGALSQDVQVDGIKPLEAINSKTGEANHVSYQVQDEPVKAPENENGVPDFSLIVDNRVCVRAAFNSDINIKYAVQGDDKTRMLVDSVKVPDAAEVTGECGNDARTLTLSWDSYSLTFNFAKNPQPENESVMTWSCQTIAVSVNTSAPKFVQPVNPGVHILTTPPGENHFNTPANFSFHCNSQSDYKLDERNNGSVSTASILAATLSLYNTQIQAFKLPKDGDFSQSAQCAADVAASLPQQNVVPIAVAGCLAGIIVIILIGYFVVRQRSKLNYSGIE